MKTCSGALTFESVDETCFGFNFCMVPNVFQYFTLKIKFCIFLEF